MARRRRRKRRRKRRREGRFRGSWRAVMRGIDPMLQSEVCAREFQTAMHAASTIGSERARLVRFILKPSFSERRNARVRCFWCAKRERETSERASERASERI
eukprot:3107014-Rhodomonas_salina.1